MAQRTTWFLIALALWGTTPAGAQPLARQRQDRRTSLPTGTSEPVTELYVAAGNLTTVAFNASLDRDSLMVDRTRFKWVDVGDRVLTLEPFTDFVPGERLILQIGFKDRALPAKAVLAVTSKADVMDGKVEVDRRANTPEALQVALTQKEAELEELKGRCEGNGPVGLVFSEWLDRFSVPVEFTTVVMPTDANSLTLLDSGGYPGRFSTLVAIRLRNPPDQASWEVGQARITDSGGSPVKVLSVQMKPAQLAPGETGLVVVEVKAPPWADSKPFTVELMAARGQRHLSFNLKKK